MADGPPLQLDAIRRRLAELVVRASTSSGNTLDQIRRELADLAASADETLGRWTACREEIANAERAVAARQASPLDPAPPVEAPAAADRLGASTFIDKGWSLLAAGDEAGAIVALRRAMELSPDDTQAESLLGWAQMRQGANDDALATFSRVLARDPNDAVARMNVGYICFQKGIFGEAIEHLSRAIRLNSDRKATLYSHFYLGLVYEQRDMFQDSESFLRKAIELGPNLIEARFELGRVLWFADRRDDARRAWQEGVHANRFSPWARRCQEMLDLVTSGKEVPRRAR